MDDNLGQSQTTKGIWMGLDDTSKILVFDIEGTDSVERGEDRLVRIRKFMLIFLYRLLLKLRLFLRCVLLTFS
jgi:hypothetical protein